MLVDTECVIPGVSDNEKFVQWLLKDGRVKYHNVVVKKSSLGGVGLFYTHNAAPDASNDRELLRLRMKFDYNTLLKDLELLGTESSAIVKTTLSTIRPTTETAILQCYFVAFKILQKLGKTSILEEISDFVPYLDILSSTHVDTLVIDSNNVGSNRYFSTVAARDRSQIERFKTLSQEVSKSLNVEDSEKFITLEEFKQIEAAVRSRVLEIPHQDEAGAEAQDDEEDYYTDVTLVPLLDFVNHSSELEKNAYFDVDKETGDILLMLKEEAVVLEGTEITICYSPNQNIQAMVSTYGFIPKLVDESVQLFEIILPLTFVNSYLRKYNEDDETDFAVALKWLQIFPLIQLVLLNGKVYINYFSNLLPLALVKGLKYDANWETAIFGENEQYSNITDSDERKVIVDLTKLQEKEYDTINGIDQKAVTLDGSYPSVETILEVKNMENEEDFAGLQKECTKMVYEYCKEEILESSSILLKETDLSTSNSLLRSYTEKEIEVLSQLVKDYESGQDLILPEEIAKDDWESDRTSPRFYY